MKTNMPVTDNEVVMKDGQMLVSKTDLKGRITYVNEAFVEISGFSEDELIGKNHNIVRHPDMPPAAFEDLWQHLKAGRPWTGLVKNRCKNGDYYWVKANVTPIYENGTVTGYMSVRTKPDARQIREAEALYDRLNTNEAAALRPTGWKQRLLDWPMMKKLHAFMAVVAVLLAVKTVLMWDGHYANAVMESGVFLFFYLVMWVTIKYMERSIADISHTLRQMTEGDYCSDIDISRNDELGRLRQIVKSTQIKLGYDFNDAVTRLNENLRIKSSLDSVTTCVMLADHNNRIIYLNKAIEKMFDHVGDAIAEVLPEYAKNRSLIGQNMDVLHNTDEHKQAHLADLKETSDSRIVLGSKTFDLIEVPVFNEQGERLGTAVEWKDVSEQVAIEHEIDDVVGAVTQGMFDRKIALDGKQGFMRTLSSNINAMIDVVAESLEEVEDVMSVIADGDLTMRVSDGHQGGFGRLAENINKMADQMLQTVGAIRESSDQVATAANEIAIGNTSMSQRTEEQASSLEETASSMEEFTSTVKQNSDNAQQANQLAMSAREQAEKGGEVVGQAVQAMAAINESSEKISDIIGVINDIAFQTNLLALNASVEAARAGEQGRGFAVVATEVRNLAQRSAQAAKEIRDLIQDSEDRVKNGSALVNESGETLEEIVNSVKKVGDIISEIAAASREQSIGIEQVNKAIGQMDEVTQQNAALAEETSAASEALNEQARNLNALMQFFNTEDNGEKNQAAEFSAMRRAHLAWKSRLRDFLDGKGTLTLKEVASHKECQLGKWLYGGALQEYGHLSGMEEMERIHADMHAAIKAVVEEKDAGNLSQAERLFNDVTNMSEQVVAYLGQIASNIKKTRQQGSGASHGHVHAHAHGAGGHSCQAHAPAAPAPGARPARAAAAASASATAAVSDDDEWEEF